MKKNAVFIRKNEVISIECFLEYYVNLRNIKAIELEGITRCDQVTYCDDVIVPKRKTKFRKRYL